ncbi:hypothetical protein AB0N09_41220 [Streptomyces erythrochromogenes]|uniref:hypothetical protein n=1 Tax=Streptomyces erythrochromogenes TaxID=285574 RepID=UPI00341590E9
MASETDERELKRFQSLIGADDALRSSYFTVEARYDELRERRGTDVPGVPDVVNGLDAPLGSGDTADDLW